MPEPFRTSRTFASLSRSNNVEFAARVSGAMKACELATSSLMHAIVLDTSSTLRTGKRRSYEIFVYRMPQVLSFNNI